MKFLLLVLSLTITGLCFSSDLPWAHLKYGSYSNLKDPVFVKINNIESVTNYWDASRSSFVYKGVCKNEATDKMGAVLTYRYLVEQNRQIVDFENLVTFGCVDKNTNEGTTEVFKLMLGDVDSLIMDMDGYSVIDSTRNIQYRGDSAKRCKEIYNQWLKNIAAKKQDEMPRFGLQWRKGKEYILVSFEIVQLSGMSFAIQRVRRSDRRIVDCETFKATETYRDYEDK